MVCLSWSTYSHTCDGCILPTTCRQSGKSYNNSIYITLLICVSEVEIKNLRWIECILNHESKTKNKHYMHACPKWCANSSDHQLFYTYYFKWFCIAMDCMRCCEEFNDLRDINKSFPCWRCFLLNRRRRCYNIKEANDCYKNQIIMLQCCHTSNNYRILSCTANDRNHGKSSWNRVYCLTMIMMTRGSLQ